MIAILAGAVVSIIAQLLKQKVENDYARLGIVLALSVIAGGTYFALTLYPNLLEICLKILGYSCAVYAFFIRRFEKKAE